MSNLRQFASHTVDVDLLPTWALVLDIGCRGFDFAREILAAVPTAMVTAYDPDPAIEAPPETSIHFERKAVVGYDRKMSMYVAFSSGEANHLLGIGPLEPGSTIISVPCVSIKEFANWDAIKLDCEGSEFGILENWPGPIAKQISVEFHDYIDPWRWNDSYFKMLFAGPLRDYRVVQHERTAVGPANTFSHWDSLLVLKG